MRTSDLVKGKNQPWKESTKGEEKRPADREGELFQGNDEGNETSYRLSAMDELKDLSPSRPTTKEKDPDVITPENSPLPKNTNDFSPPKGIERTGPGYRLSDFDALNFISRPMSSRSDETLREGEVRQDAQRKAEQVVRQQQNTDATKLRESEASSKVTGRDAEKDSFNTVPAQHSVDDNVAAQQRYDEVREIYGRALDYLRYVREKIQANELFKIDPAIALVQTIIDMHYDMSAEIYQMTVDLGEKDDYTFSHAVNTSIYSIRIGQHIGYTKKALIELGLSALLCDIGMFKIPDSILNKEGKLLPNEIDLIKSHPKISRDIMLTFGKEYQPVANAVLEHQERENGQGYPRGLKGNEISAYAKIIGICDSYEAMTHNRPHKRALMQTESIRELIGSKNQLFAPQIIKVFLDVISIFPIGCYVRLNNRNIGCVIATSRSNPLKPTIKLLYDENGRRFTEPKIIDLRSYPVLNIESSVALHDLPE